MSKIEEGCRLCVGVDLHKTQFTVCAVDEDGNAVHEEEYPTDRMGYARFSRRMHIEERKGYSIEIAVESTGNARFFKNCMEVEGFAVKVVNTNKFKVITMSTSKTDKHDAYTLAYYLWKGMLPESHLCSQTSEEIRRMLKTRSLLVQACVKIKNQIHGMMLGYGIETSAAQFQSKKKRQELIGDLEGQDYSQFTASSLKLTIDILDNLEKEINRVEKQLEEMVRENDTVELLQTVPGIGFIGATTIAAYTEDMERFDGNFKQFAAYLGIVPSVHDSNETHWMGKITKHGPQDLRTAFVQVALGIIRQKNKYSDWYLIKDYEYKKKEKGSGRAIIALTRKVARIVFAMLNSREVFDPARMVSGYPKQQQQAA